jgi:hypothetical protein
LSEDIYAALSRTALLIAADVFDATAGHRDIIDGLRATTARIVADRTSLGSPAGQTALVTLYAQLAMMGLQIDLDVPDVELLAPQPPLRGNRLVSGLRDYAADLLPGGSGHPSATPEVVFALGSAAAPGDAVRVAGGPWHAQVGAHAPTNPWRGDVPVGAMAAAAAAAVDGLRAALPRIAERLDRPVPADRRWRLIPGRQVNLDLLRYRVDGAVRLGDVDAISGGAITNAALFALLRLPEITGRVRVIEHDLLAISNLNRYALARRSMLTWPKATALQAFSTPNLRLTGRVDKLDISTVAQLGPIAPRLLVGVDHIPSRWLAQRAAGSGWVCVGSSSHDFVLVSTHPRGTSCAGCAHPRDDDFTGDIPTISFVSFWAGLIQALELLAEAGGRAPAWARSTEIWPLGLDNPHGIRPYPQAAAASCPVRCAASARQRAA